MLLCVTPRNSGILSTERYQLSGQELPWEIGLKCDPFLSHSLSLYAWLIRKVEKCTPCCSFEICALDNKSEKMYWMVTRTLYTARTNMKEVVFVTHFLGW